MTPIQQHEQELRAMMERAWLVPSVGDKYIQGAGLESTVTLYQFSGSASAVVFAPNGNRVKTNAEHPDPRIALRHCLEMAGLIEDRPPRTYADVARWLTDRCGEPDVRRSTALGRSIVWTPNGQKVQAVGPVGPDKVWQFNGVKGLASNELGAILWCAEKWPEVQS